VLTQDQLATYLSGLDKSQAECVLAIRSLLCKSEIEFEEKIETGKWWNGLLVYSAEQITCFALGPASGSATTFHMMPFYGSKELRARNAEILKKFLTGKSCIRLKCAQDIPVSALEDIIGATPKFLMIAKQMESQKKQKPKPAGE
jgi:hypothetical protein